MNSPVVLRRDLVRVGRLMYERGLIAAAEGNLSVRLGGRLFLVTPSGVSKGALRPQDILEVGADGRCVHGQPTSEWPLHRELYGLRDDVGAICHAHPPWATAFAVAGRDLDGSVLTETAEIMPLVPLAPRVAPGTEDLAASVVPLIKNHDAVLLGNHGVVAVGKDLAEAFARLETVERLAQVTLLAEVALGRSTLAPDSLARLMSRLPDHRN